jgi:hypothetical protein
MDKKAASVRSITYLPSPFYFLSIWIIPRLLPSLHPVVKVAGKTGTLHSTLKTWRRKCAGVLSRHHWLDLIRRMDHQPESAHENFKRKKLTFTPMIKKILFSFLLSAAL